LEALAQAESAAAELAAMELAELGTSGPVSLGEPEAVAGHVVESPVEAVYAPEPASPGSAQTPVGQFDDPVSGTPSGWLPDPSGLPDVLRYWDGHAWTFHVATRSVKP
jgi:hypothetical protein